MGTPTERRAETRGKLEKETLPWNKFFLPFILLYFTLLLSLISDWSNRRFLEFSSLLIGYLDIIGFAFFDSLISVWREMRTNSGLCFSQLLRYLYLACFSKFSNNFEYWRIFLMFLTRTLIFFKGPM